jgi:hypothetical protein
MAGGFNFTAPGGGSVPTLAARAGQSVGSVYKPFNAASDIVTLQKSIITKGLWTGDAGSLTTFFTSSNETSTQKEYYYEIFQSASSALDAQPQFAVSYGNLPGSGSTVIAGGSGNDTPTRAIYSQYKQLLLEIGDTSFTFDGKDSEQIYIVNVNRARYKEGIDPSAFYLNIAHLSGSEFVAGSGAIANAYTGSNVGVSDSNLVLELTTDYAISNAGTAGQSGLKYNIVSGSSADGVYSNSLTSTDPQYFGILYPTLGIAVLDGTALNMSCSFGSVTGSGIDGDNALKLHTAISGAAVIDSTNNGFTARNKQSIKSDFYFVRVQNNQFNYSNNPSYVTGEEGAFSVVTVGDPFSYITSVGLYNANKELVAVAKLSKPLKKDPTTETTIKVKLDY